MIVALSGLFSCFFLQFKGSLKGQRRKAEIKTDIKYNWEKIIEEQFQSILDNKMELLHDGYFVAPKDVLSFLGEYMKEAASKSVASKAVKIQGLWFRASHIVKNLLKECKKPQIIWKENDSPGPDSDSYIKRKEAKQNLRKQLLKENFMKKKEKIYYGFMENPDTKHFTNLSI